MKAGTQLPTIKTQMAAGVAWAAIAVVIAGTLHPEPKFTGWSSGLPPAAQVAVAALFGLSLALLIAIGFRVPAIRRRIPVPSILRQIDLTGARPLLIGLFAGVGEELLFRGALQPMIGIWPCALLFALAHTQTAKLGFESVSGRAAYLVYVLLVGVMLGHVFEVFGLIAAVLIHAAIDIVVLYAYSILIQKSLVQRAA